MSERCQEYFERLSELLDGELDQGTAEEIRSHIETCPECRFCWATFKKSVEIFQRFSAESIPLSMLLELKAFIRESLR
ncbi:MAG: zf-HC2 domain-containing protein [Thermodesulfobacteriota bacterium]|nr:zf-HC2 domain-containing protein [Thermodesulfobacteriota bacterium]